MDRLCNKLADARDLVERIEMLGSAPPMGLELQAREFELRRRALLIRLASTLGEAFVEACLLARR